MIRFIEDKNEKSRISREILEALTDWFEVEESREQYIRESEDQHFWAAVEDGVFEGFLCLKETGKETMELAVMGVKKDCHRKGIGRRLFSAAKDYAATLTTVTPIGTSVVVVLYVFQVHRSPAALSRTTVNLHIIYEITLHFFFFSRGS